MSETYRTNRCTKCGAVFVSLVDTDTCQDCATAAYETTKELEKPSEPKRRKPIARA